LLEGGVDLLGERLDDGGVGFGAASAAGCPDESGGRCGRQGDEDVTCTPARWSE
jgi:hypothetical protein